jgi:anti-sigma-K factor RskA
MDKLARQLRDDAERIDASISPELDARITASLHAVTPVREGQDQSRQRSWSFWLTSSLTGAAAAIAAIAIVNMRQPEIAEPAVVTVAEQSSSYTVPVFDLKAETAVLTNPLSEELQALQSDLKKAEQKVREDVGL